MMLQCHQIAMEFLVMLSTPPLTKWLRVLNPRFAAEAMGYAIINQEKS